MNYLHARDFMIPKKSGYYKWYATEEALKTLLNSKHLSKKYFDEIFHEMHHHQKIEVGGKEYYYVYIGIADSLSRRLHEHISGTQRFSTIRTSIGSLIEKQNDEAAISEFIGTLVFEYCELADKDKLKQIETTQMHEYVLPLNIKDNENHVVKGFEEELTALRKKNAKPKKTLAKKPAAKKTKP